MYNQQDVLEVLQKRLFAPLTLKIANGEQYEIAHPEQVMVTSTKGLSITTPSRKKPGTVD